MGIIGWIIVGLLAGALAGRVTGVRGNGCLATMAIGVIGGLVGGALFDAAGGEGIGDFGLYSLFVAFIGATILLFVYNALTGAGRRRRR
ncbi:MAG: GlsB/YeaQ/YmgE family stress response membrane protein [Acidimicrobiales bacterium]|nr:GlsB/YeaQ/YmgE family stress response membrane protein [Acidimicrobiales bacterium]